MDDNSANKKSIFILGASSLQIPAILYAKSCRMFVYAIDYDPNAPGIKFADRYLNISTTDTDNIYKAALHYKPTYIITSTSDLPVQTVSFLNEKLGNPTEISYLDSICATNKLEMRKRMLQHGVPIPLFYEISCLNDLLNLYDAMPNKFVIKPVDNAASRGVVCIEKNNNPSLEQIYNYSKNFSRSGKIIIEELLEGKEVSVESYTENGIPHIVSITDKIVTPLPYFVELGHTEPSVLPNEQIADVIDVATRAIKALNMRDGPNHTEIIVSPAGAKLVEIAARLGGDFITSKLVPLSTGVDLVGCTFSWLLKQPVSYKPKYHKGAAIRFISASNKGILRDIKGLDLKLNCKQIHEIQIYKHVGDVVNPPQNSNDRIGHIIATGETAEEASYIADQILNSIQTEVE